MRTEKRMRGMLSILLLELMLTSVAGLVSAQRTGIEQCEEITIPMCRNIGYNYTYMPNPFNHDTQEEAALEAHQFWPLVEIHCSVDLKFFLCSMYAPICMPRYPKYLPACKSVCERAKNGCAPLMRKYGFAWPERMNCDDLPNYGDRKDPTNLCMDPLNGEEPSDPLSPGNFNPISTLVPGQDVHGTAHVPEYTMPTIPYVGGLPTTRYPGIKWPVVDVIMPNMNGKCMCHPPMVVVSSQQEMYFNKVYTGGVVNCARPCKNPFFTKKEREFADIWIGLWSILCFVSTSTTLLTFLIDMQRFKYPERPIIFLSACYVMVSLAYIIRLGVGHKELSCDSNVIRYSAEKDYRCIIVFLLSYFFGMASSIWWVILALTWFLAAGMKWGNEAIASYSVFYHLAAWLIPTAKSMAALWLSSVDGDSISGLCYVGNQNLGNLRGYVLAPLFVYLILGTSFLLGGFVSLFRIRNVIKQQGRTKTDKLEKLMIRIGVFSVLYTVPASIVIGCYFYEQHFREEWEKTITCGYADRTKNIKPIHAIFMLKYFMCLVIGITSGFWIWSGKTLDSWKRFYARCCGRGVAPRASGGAGQVLVPTGGIIVQPAGSHVINNGPNQVRVTLATESIAPTIASSVCKSYKQPNYNHVSHMNLQKQIPLSHV